MAHGQVGKGVLVLGQTLVFVGVVDVHRSAVIGHAVDWDNQDCHRVCDPVEIGCVGETPGVGTALMVLSAGSYQN